MLETEQDRENEERISARMAKFLNCEYRRMGSYFWFDVYFYRVPNLDFAGVAEVKCRRTKSFEAIPNVLIDADKYQNLYWNAMSLACPAYFVVEYKEGIIYADIAKICGYLNKFEIKVIGRTDRGHPTDIRPAIMIPKVYFSII